MTNVANGETDIFERLARFFSPDMMDSIRQSVASRAPDRKVTESYLKSVGILKLDERRSVLVDSSISAGPLRFLAILATFSSFPEKEEEIRGKLLLADPDCGEGPLLNGGECADAIVMFRRGKVSFANKVLQAQALGAKAVIVTQTGGSKWPFSMTDSAGEIGGISSVPVLMLSAEDADLLLQFVKSNAYDVVSIKLGEKSNECPICQDGYDASAEVLKLPCRHTYHSNCMTSWLQHNHTCPMCRLKLESQTQKKKAEETRAVAFDFVS